jgi:hypothetical protein
LVSLGLALVGAAEARTAPSANRALAAELSDRPDLVPVLPLDPASEQEVDATFGRNVAPEYVDAYSWEKPGALLYRFDSVILNKGGTLDLFRDATTGHTIQAIWPNGIPDPLPDPDLPAGGAATLEDRTIAVGAVYEYPASRGHFHWHFNSAARYELVRANSSVIESEKIGFCMIDSWGGRKYFPYQMNQVGGWCQPGRPDAGFVRMGISPGVGDYYASQVPSQWIDVTGLPPGRYTLRATVNPLGHILESRTDNNVLEVERTIPGTVVAPIWLVTPLSAATFALAGTVIGPQVPARTSADCPPAQNRLACYVFAGRTGPLTFQVVSGPEHGTLEIVAQTGTRAIVRYTPSAGYEGRDRFTYSATDARTLTSTAATVEINVAGSARTVAERLVGTSESDIFVMTTADDTIVAGGGDDDVTGGAGNDRLQGEGGNDRLAGGPGNDALVGGPGNDNLAGGPGNDTIQARKAGKDVVTCGPGRDRVVADAGDRVARDCETVAR